MSSKWLLKGTPTRHLRFQQASVDLLPKFDALGGVLDTSAGSERMKCEVDRQIDYGVYKGSIRVLSRTIFYLLQEHNYEQG